jgi:hypothetical protein
MPSRLRRRPQRRRISPTIVCIVRLSGHRRRLLPKAFAGDAMGRSGRSAWTTQPRSKVRMTPRSEPDRLWIEPPSIDFVNTSLLRLIT